MSDIDSNAAEALSPMDRHSTTAGNLLRAAREAQGLHVAALAVAMKVPVKKLEALEADRLDQLSDPVFVRALASGVCRALKVDSALILEKLPRSPIPRLDRQERAVNAPFTVPNQSKPFTLPEFLTKPAVIGVLVLVLGAGILLWMPDSLSGLGRIVSPRRPMVSEPVVAPFDTGAGNVVSTPVAVTGAAQLAGVAAAPQPLADASQPTVLGKSDVSVNGPDIAGPASGLVTFRARASSWVEVTDAKGVVQLRKTLQSGEKAAASGDLPLSVVIGRADVTEVEVRGKQFALEAVAKENVARFEVK
ncbi:MAG: DUF4115 domain-containing protein [Burkholderiales bacterium]|nr:DUF4115 domain-containing protein [Burkholderiales bacterium]